VNTKLLPLILLLGCPGGDKADDTAAVSCDESGPITLTDANNYSFTGALDVPVVVTASATDITLNWDQVVEDIQCHAIDPAADIDTVGLVRFSTLTQDEVELGLSTNDLQQSAMSGYVQFENDAEVTTTTLGVMSFFGTQIVIEDEYFEGGGTYMLLLTTGSTPGVGARMITFLEPQAAASETTVDVANGCGVLDFAVDLTSLTSPAVCTDGPYDVDWSAITVDGQGNAVDASQIDNLLLGYYPGLTVADIEADFLDLESLATNLYELPLTGGTTADLTLASDGTTTFSGFSGDGVWVLALQCSRCYNPAPLFVTVLNPTDPA
jgi:hypothetical protein